MATTLDSTPPVPAASPPLVAAGFAAATLAVGMSVAWWGISLGELDETALRNPPLWPPAWAFWAVWVALYPTLGVATWFVWRLRAGPPARAALAVFGVHLLVNLSWLPVVHGTRSALVAPVVMDLTADVFVAAAVRAYGRVSRTALVWLIPYAAWNLFTTVIKVWRLWLNA